MEYTSDNKYGGDIYILYNKDSIHCFWYNGKYCVKWKYGDLK